MRHPIDITRRAFVAGAGSLALAGLAARAEAQDPRVDAA